MTEAPGTPSLTSSWQRLALTGLLVLLTSACIGYDPSYLVIVDNRTDETIYWHPVGYPESRDQITPHTRSVIRLSGDGCTRVEYVAFAEDGTELSRLPPGACNRDTWIIEEPR